MIYGIPPFYNENIEKMYDNIMYSIVRFPMKKRVSAEAQDLILKLLEKNPERRLGSNQGLSEIKAHSFFKSANFDLLTKKKEKAPFTPIIQNKYDLKYFDSDIISENPEIQAYIPEKNLELIRSYQDKFRDF